MANAVLKRGLLAWVVRTFRDRRNF